MYQLILESQRPSRLVADKNADYHIKQARYCISDGYSAIHNRWVTNCDTNRRFYVDDQWWFKSDVEVFLKDETSQSRNREPVVINLIRKIINQYAGNAKNLNITMRAENLSYKAINRREQKLAELIYFTELAKNANPETANYIKSKMPIGNTAEETQSIFENLWTDEYTTAVNNFIEYIFAEEELDKRKSELAMDLAFTGMINMKYEIHNNEFKFRKITPEYFFWDRTAKEYDLADAEYQGEKVDMSPTTIYEKYPKLGKENKEQIENAVKDLTEANVNKYILGGKIPVYKVYWRDTEDIEFGYVLDEFGYPYCTRINYVFEGYENPRYTDKDLIPVDKLSENQKSILKGSNKATLAVDLIRFADIIPSEILSNKGKKTGTYTDILLDYGIMPFQETDSYKLCNVKYPFKVYCWYYFEGYVDTPVNALIDPQRRINQLASVSQNLINCAMPSNLFYDKTMLDDQSGEAGLLKSKYQGKPYGLKARGQGINNAVMVTQSTLDRGQLTINSQLQEQMAGNMNNIIGLNEPMTGGSTGSEQLVGVTAQQIQRSSIVQEPFYTAIVECYKQMTQSIVSVARRLYSDDERKLSIMIGDKKAQILQLSKEYSTEYFRVFVNHEPDMKSQIQVANQVLIGMLQMGLINKETYADLYNRSTPEDIADAIRKQANDDKEIARMQGEQQMIQMKDQMTLQALAEEKQNEKDEQNRTDVIIDKELERKNKLERELIKAGSKQQVEA